MRKIHKKKLLEGVHFLKQAHKDLETAHEPRIIKGILDSCEINIDIMCQILRDINAEKTKTARIATEYQALVRRSQKRINGRLSAMERKRAKIEDYIEKELIPDKIEVVFFPYKASMSDSFATIYQAAKADPDCDAYWCPIPYYENNPDGTPGEVFYEPYGYVSQGDIIDWQSYDEAARHPDIIFIHNPYDHTNFVTSVLPRYYSERLKKCTDLLVYVDYGIPVWCPRDAETADVKNSYILPGLQNADVVVSYSQEFANLVIKTMLSGACVNLSEQEKNILPQKVVPLGSAKFDIALKAQRESFQLPSEWAERIGERKILLYNTSMVKKEYRKNFFDHIRQTIETVAARDDTILWWRPHPLLESTLRQAFPDLLPSYESIVRTFKSEKQGIYDDTWDIHRAIVWSDGCLTTESSICWFYLANGKPFTIFDFEGLLKNPKIHQGPAFHLPIWGRLQNMRAGKGACPKPEWNVCVWWEAFLEEDKIRNVRYANFLNRFLHYIVHREQYPEAIEYIQQQTKIFRDFVVNPDATSGEKIYKYCKGRIIP